MNPERGRHEVELARGRAEVAGEHLVARPRQVRTRPGALRGRRRVGADRRSRRGDHTVRRGSCPHGAPTTAFPTRARERRRNARARRRYGRRCRSVASMLASVATFTIDGVDSVEVTVEVDVRRGLPAFTVVGLPDAAVREARERVRAALLNSRLEFPLKRLTANLAPADLRKSGPELRPRARRGTARRLRPGPGRRPRHPRGLRRAVAERRPPPGPRGRRARGGCAGRRLPPPDRAGGELRRGRADRRHRGAGRSVARAHGRAPEGRVPAWPSVESSAPGPAHRRARPSRRSRSGGCEASARDRGGRAVITCSWSARPGVGKTMLARRLPGILPPPDPREALEITRVQSVAGLSDGRLARERPFRSPHHTISPPGLVGGGPGPRPGEITLAHRGVLFLDELAEFSRPALEALREPLEAGRVEITRRQRRLVFPARFMLVGACNDCPCGKRGDECECTALDRSRVPAQVERPAARSHRPRLLARPGAADRAGAVAARAARPRPRPSQRAWPRPASGRSHGWPGAVCSRTPGWAPG